MKKRFFTSVMSLLLVMATLFGIASAAVVAGVDPFYIEGAQIRTTGKQGIRFVAYLEKDLYQLTYGSDANFGILIARKDRLSEGAEITMANATAVPAKNLLENTDTYCRFTAVITDQPAEFYGVELVARAYVNVNGTVYYSRQISRSIKQVADMILEQNRDPDDISVAESVLARYREVRGDITIKADDLWNTLLTYPEYPEQIARDYEYSVSIEQGSNKKQLVVYNQTEDYFYQNRFDGGDTNRRFCEFAFEGEPVTVHIQVNRDFNTYAVAPTSKRYDSVYNDGVISVTVTEPTQFILMLDDDVNSAISVFADAPETNVPAENDANTVYVKGWNEVNVNKTGATFENGILTLSGGEGKQIYIEPGAVLVARVVIASDAYKAKIFGRGAILDPFSRVYDMGSTVATNGSRLVELNGYDGIVQDVKLLDSRTFNLNVNSGYCVVDNVKILSTRMTSDGITAAAERGGTKGIIKNCFVYCGDNALVTTVGSGEGYLFKNITVGTTCSAIYPQYNVNSTFEDIYVFRADEGLISVKQKVNNGLNENNMTVTINNLDALDCVNTPYLFYTQDQGSGVKTFNMNKILVRYTTGSASSSALPGTTTNEKTLFGSSTTNGGNNYQFNITDLYVGGNLITLESQIKASGSATIERTYTSSGNAPAVTSGCCEVVNYTCRGKVMIGDRQVFLKNAPLAANGTWYLPYEEIVTYLAIKPQEGTVVDSTSTGRNVISLENLVASGAASAAGYDEVSGTIQLTASTTASTNLLQEDYEQSSNFNPLYYADKTPYMTATKEGDTWVYTAESNDSDEGGIVRMILDEYQQYGAGKYRITFDYLCSSTGGFLWDNKITVGIAVDHDKALTKEFSMKKSWTSASWDVDLSNYDPAETDLMALYFTVISGNTISIRNVSLIKIS